MGIDAKRHMQTSYEREDAWLVNEGSPILTNEAAIFESALRDLAPNRALEVGCGRGRVTRLITQFCDTLVSTDLTGEMVRSTRDRLDWPNCHFALADADRLPFKDNQFDVVVATQVIGHLPDSVNFLSEVARVLVENGTLILSTGNPWNVTNLKNRLSLIVRMLRSNRADIKKYIAADRKREFWIEQQGHCRDSPLALLEMLGDGGFDVRSMSGVGAVPLTIYDWLESDGTGRLSSSLKHFVRFTEQVMTPTFSKIVVIEANKG